MTIYFYNPRDVPYGCFSNFSRHGFHLDGTWWPTSEHYFQAQKFAGTPHVGDVLRAPSPGKAAAIGRDRGRPLRPDWEQVKDDMMRRAVRAKFEQNEDIREVLLGTGNEDLVEATTHDTYWGCGSDGAGQNRLGVILMEVRARLQAQQPVARATRDDWHITSLPEQRERLDYARVFSEAEYALLTHGFLSRDMDDKWFIFLEDAVLYFHRSWTGFCIFTLRLESAAGGGVKVVEAWASRNLEQYNSQGEAEDIRTLNILIDRLLLKRIE
ncbi:MAG: NADAR family protein [Anaerolineae bacterium]|nr:NADAR family protein [Anaerolineae bacterium]